MTDMNSTVTSVSAYIGEIKKITSQKSRRYAYRGESDVDWKLAPGIMRNGRERLLSNERNATRDLISVHPNEFVGDETMFDRLVRMQHFGLPTRLLDVTGNPLVALFNATETIIDGGAAKDGRVYRISVPHGQEKYYDSDTISCVSNISNLPADERDELFINRMLPIIEFNDPANVKASDRLLQFIRAEKPSFRPIINGRELANVWYVIPKLSNRRIIAQNGAFLIYGLCKEAEIPSGLKGITYRTITIPNGHKSAIRHELSILGITESALFPEIDKAAKLVRDQYS